MSPRLRFHWQNVDTKCLTMMGIWIGLSPLMILQNASSGTSLILFRTCCANEKFMTNHSRPEFCFCSFFSFIYCITVWQWNQLPSFCLQGQIAEKGSTHSEVFWCCLTKVFIFRNICLSIEIRFHSFRVQFLQSFRKVHQWRVNGISMPSTALRNIHLLQCGRRSWQLTSRPILWQSEQCDFPCASVRFFSLAAGSNDFQLFSPHNSKVYTQIVSSLARQTISKWLVRSKFGKSLKLPRRQLGKKLQKTFQHWNTALCDKAEESPPKLTQTDRKHGEGKYCYGQTNNSFSLAGCLICGSQPLDKYCDPCE